MADKPDEQIPALFATIHFRSDRRPHGYTADEIEELNIEANRHVPELYAELTAQRNDRMTRRLVTAVQTAGITPNLSDGYYYASLPLCVIDAVFSIGVRYEGVKEVVRKWCSYPEPDWRRFSEERRAGRAVPGQYSISQFLEIIDGLDDDELAGEQVLDNRQRTSPRNGILKATAVRQFAQALAQHGVEQFGDTLDDERNSDVEREVIAITGQSSGLSWGYFLMLAGSDEYVKPDRMLCRFVCSAMDWQMRDDPETRRRVGDLVIAAAHYLNVAPRALDHAIWSYERLRKRPSR